MDRGHILTGYVAIGVIVIGVSLFDPNARARNVFDYVLIGLGWPVYVLRQLR